MELVGGHPAVDLVNTVSWRADPQRTVDRLAGPEDLGRWLTLANLGQPPHIGPRALASVRWLREVVHGPLASVVDSAAPSTGDLAAIKRAAFLDTSRSRTRRWCSTADCGNRERVRRHNARRREE